MSQAWPGASPQLQEDSYDGRSLAEKLAANRAAKQEEWEEKSKLANQFRALEEDEIMFLDSVRERQEEEERQRKEKDGEEVRGFKEAVAARTSAVNNPPPHVPKPMAAPKPTPVAPPKKDVKRSLKGVVVKKRVKSAVVPPKTEPKQDKKTETDDDDGEPNTKRRKVIA
ncbi:N-terminal domain of NEFA-interacting nuclear protein NIP30-domain-containing protein [Infundibulicybe gibba]|nr:N-terminal domain of NEFA-interacting nuclear protein NIP30-domain-containing protein [Infundibulicybe gibba]